MVEVAFFCCERGGAAAAGEDHINLAADEVGGQGG